jgi:predicted nuclease with RNAse H fold
MKNKIKYFAGIDVQISRGCSYYILDSEKKYVISGWVKDNVLVSFKKLFSKLTDNQGDIIAIGIDAPRMPLKKLRTRYFNRKKNKWDVESKQSNGRECEVIIKSYNIANPQWTRTLNDSPDWMQLGFSIFDSLKDFSFVYEVFPSASYKMLENENVKYELCLNEFNSGVKDMLDASVAALTVFEFVNGQGCEVGGDDGLGTIVLPRKILL